jgi:hypothetical protein
MKNGAREKKLSLKRMPSGLNIYDVCSSSAEYHIITMNFRVRSNLRIIKRVYIFLVFFFSLPQVLITF